MEVVMHMCMQAFILDASVTGSGDIYYSGNPSSPQINKLGSGNVHAEKSFYMNIHYRLSVTVKLTCEIQIFILPCWQQNNVALNLKLH